MTGPASPLSTALSTPLPAAPPAAPAPAASPSPYAPGGQDTAPTPRLVTGPRLARLTAALADAASDAEHEALVAEFWAEAERRGTPLIEPLDGDPEHCAVTFLWRGHRATRQVLLLANRLMDRDHLAASLLHRLPGTDIWHLGYRLRADHRGSYRMAADLTTGALPTDPEVVQRRLRALSVFAAADPLNRHPMPTRWRAADSSVFAGPRAPAQPWQRRRDGIPRGAVARHPLPSGALGAARDIWTYTPPGHGHRELPVAVLCDGDMWFGQLGFQDTLDALIADGALPPLVVLAPDAVDNATRWRELGAHDPYVAFLADEVLPWAAGRWPLSTDPAHTLIAGQSLGGLTALYCGFQRPDRFGRVLAQSASLWWRPGLPPGVPRAAGGGTPWLASLYAEGDRRPLRVHLDVGLHEGAMVDHSRVLLRTLRARGYEVTCDEFNGGHDYACWRGALADGLVSLLAT